MSLQFKEVKDTYVKIPTSWEHPQDHFHQVLKSEWYQTIYQIKKTIFSASYEFYKDMGLSPAMMPITCESVSSPMGLGSDSLPVSVDLFDKKTYLADSMQFQLEYLLRLDEKGVWYIMPTFRGEDHGKRHLNQFFHSEAEIVGDLDDVIALVEKYVIYLTTEILKNHSERIKLIAGTLDHLNVVKNKTVFKRVSFTEAYEILGDNADYYDDVLPGIKNISHKGEVTLMEKCGECIWLTHMPSATVPFYQAIDTDGKHSLCADLLMGIGEVIGCGQRHTTKLKTMESLLAHQVDPDNYSWYLDMKEDYAMETSGFGMGIERFILWLLKHDDIRDIPLMTRLKGQIGAP